MTAHTQEACDGKVITFLNIQESSGFSASGLQSQQLNLRQIYKQLNVNFWNIFQIMEWNEHVHWTKEPRCLQISFLANDSKEKKVLHLRKLVSTKARFGHYASEQHNGLHAGRKNLKHNTGTDPTNEKFMTNSLHIDFLIHAFLLIKRAYLKHGDRVQIFIFNFFKF